MSSPQAPKKAFPSFRSHTESRPKFGTPVCLTYVLHTPNGETKVFSYFLEPNDILTFVNLTHSKVTTVNANAPRAFKRLPPIFLATVRIPSIGPLTGGPGQK